MHGDAGVSFATALRSILRQDPDVVMIGEMRDSETAEIAVQAAMTGHLVLSTLHTNDTLGAIPRLIDLGVPDYLVSATLEGVLAQRLVRRVCEQCAVLDDVDPALVAELTGCPAGKIQLRRGVGCRACRGTGFWGRLGIFEFLPVNDDVRGATTRRAGRSELREIAVDAGFVSMRLDGWAKIQRGITTIAEVLRVVR